jgi:hypothetical protein
MVREEQVRGLKKEIENDDLMILLERRFETLSAPGNCADLDGLK